MMNRPAATREDQDAAGQRASAQAVSAEAQRQTPDGVAIDPRLGRSAALAMTQAAVAASRTILGARFVHEGVHAAIDILEPERDGWRIIAVRSATKAKPDHLGPLATQAWVAAANGLSVASLRVRHLNRDFTLSHSGDRAGLFTDTDVTSSIVPLLAQQASRVAAARALLNGGEPAPVGGDHCHFPKPCRFVDHCQTALPPGPRWPVTVLPRGAGKPFLRRGIDDLTEIHADQLRLDIHRRVHRATLTGRVEHDPVGAATAIAAWPFPRIWLDFETVSDAVPVWSGCTPYEQVPFQFVADVEVPDGIIARREFLSLGGEDPRRACAEALAALPTHGAVIAWNARFERDVILRLAGVFPDISRALEGLAARVVDLLPITRDHWYHRDQRGSWSLKAVLPTIAPHLDYATLEVKDGGNAVEAYREASNPGCPPQRRAALDGALRAYCGRDVEAMRVIAQRLIE
jgi:hypothetical protein